MTKPDTLPAGATKARELWLDVIEGRRHALKHGYFCTRQPDDEERANAITNRQARDAETRFFSSTFPWATSTQQHRFGTNKLVETLSRLLTTIIDAVYVRTIRSCTCTKLMIRLVCPSYAGRSLSNFTHVSVISAHIPRPSHLSPPHMFLE